ncbi:MAG: methionine--tRNA ligase [Bradymonadales bacterium]|nr:methionine--tRNA ligase [Bradymonadales bacterium]
MALLDLYRFDDRTDRILVTCALPYVNNVPHLGNMVPILSADVYHRYLQLKGIRSIYICATDEHGTRTEIEAARAGLDEETYCRRLHDRMLEIFRWFHVDFTHFGRTSCPENHQITQDIFRKADANGFVSEQEIRQLYCEHDRRYLPDTYVEGTCPFCNTPGAKGDQCDVCGRFLDPLELLSPRCKTCGNPPVIHSTRHLFLDLDRLSPLLTRWLESKTDWDGLIKNMPLGWIAEGLKPRAITRDLKWGIPVPKKGYQDKVFYVWFDAPIGYIASTAEWASGAQQSLDDWWKGGRARLIHFLGKDNVPFHTLMWPGSLIAADNGYNLPDYIAANSYLNYEGGAFSKSRQRGVFSDDVCGMGFPADAMRFYLMAFRPEKKDTDFSFETFQNLVNADLVGNIGNLANRLLTFLSKRYGEIPRPGELGQREQETLKAAEAKIAEIDSSYATFEFRTAVRSILELSDIANGYFQVSEPWKSFKNDPTACGTSLFLTARILHDLARWTWPIMPERCQRILEMMGSKLSGQLEPGLKVPTPSLLFAPIEEERVEEWLDRYRGQTAEPRVEPLVFVKESGISWPCVILEFSNLHNRRRINALERWKESILETLDLELLESSPRLKAYQEVLVDRDLGGRTVSVQNLIDIVRREGKIPNINALVDIYNLFSLKEATVMGAYERRTIQGRLIYAVADGQEHFIPVKGEDREPIRPGEWVLKDDSNMVVTKIVTKQAEAAAVTTATTHCAMCIQGNSLTSVQALRELAIELADLVVTHCAGSYRIVFAG